MLDPTLASALAHTLERSINSVLRYDPGTRSKLRKLHGCVFQFACTSPELDLFLEIDSTLTDNHTAQTDFSSVRISSYSEKAVTTKISGSLLDCLIFMASNDVNQTSNLNDSGIRVTGSSAKLSTLQSLLHDLDHDWEIALQQFTAPLGECANVFGHQAANAFKSFTEWLENTRSKVKRNFSTWLQEELKVIPTKTELDNFSVEVSSLRSDIDRTEARLNQLENKLTDSKRQI